MEQLMKELAFPEDAVREVTDADKKLQEGIWGRRLDEMAAGLMEKMKKGACRGELQEALSGCEQMEEETGIHRYTLDLLFLLRCAGILRENYKKKGLPDDLFLDSMMDLKWKLLECRNIYGVNGIFVGFWYDRFFDMTRFALGRFQFEEETFQGDLFQEDGFAVKKGAPVINMHIPSSGPLDPAQAEASIARAAQFYRDLFPQGTVPFVMESWLLDPDLMKMLPQGNIRRFVERFHLVSVEKGETFSDGWRVFGPEWEKDPADLPRTTRLQMAIADYLQGGGKLGAGYGIFLWKQKDA